MNRGDICSRVRHTIAQILKVETVDFARIISTDEVNDDYEIIRFTRDLYWIRETRTCWFYNYNGDQIRRGSMRSDNHGFLTSYEEVLPEAQQYAIAKGCKVGEQPVVEVRMEITTEPVIKAPEWAIQKPSWEKRTGLHYLLIPGDWLYDNDKVETRRKGMKTPGMWSPADVPETITTSVLLWSSANTPEVNQQLFEDAMRVARQD